MEVTFYESKLCLWEHNGDDTILYSSNFVGAFTRGKSRSEAIQKMPSEIMSYLKWKGDLISDILSLRLFRKASELTISDADSDVLLMKRRSR